VGWAELGYLGGAADLEKDDQTCLAISHTLQNGLDITGSLTLMGWAKPESSGSYMMMAAKYQVYAQGQAENAGYRLGLDDDNQLQFIVSPDGTYYEGYELNGTTTLANGAWRHVAAVFDGQAGEMRLYLDGGLEVSRTVAHDGVHPSTAPFMLGANLDQTGAVFQHFDGQLDEWRVYARALSQAEIASVMGLPGASFVAEPVQGFAPLVVTVTNVSTNATTYVWDLGDGSAPSAVESPVHTYTQVGVYTVTLHASDGTVTDTLTRPAYVWATSVSQGMQGWWRLEEADGRHPWAGRATMARPTATT
jgi:hypothetical protein